MDFNGQYLGAYHFNDVISHWKPCDNTSKYKNSIPLFVCINISNVKYFCILKRNARNKIDQIIIDEIKEVFGLKKIGINRIRIHGVPEKIGDDLLILKSGKINCKIAPIWSYYYLISAHGIFNSSGSITFFKYPTISSIDWDLKTKKKYQDTLYKIKYIFAFKYYVNIFKFNLDDVLIDPSNPSQLLSVNETIIKDIVMDGKTPDFPNKIFKMFFSETYLPIKIIIENLGIHNLNYVEKITELKNKIYDIIKKLDNSYIWLADQIYDRMINSISIYYDNNN